MVTRKKTQVYTTKDGQKYRLRVTYEVVAVKVKGVKRGTVVRRGRYTTKRDALKSARASFDKKRTSRKKSIEQRYRKAYGHGLVRTTQLTHFHLVHTTRKLNHKGEIGGLFIFTYQMNGKKTVYDTPIEAYSSTTRVPITRLSDVEITRYIAQALSFARIQFLQKLGIETADILLEEFIPPVRYKYYIPKSR